MISVDAINGSIALLPLTNPLGPQKNNSREFGSIPDSHDKV